MILLPLMAVAIEFAGNNTCRPCHAAIVQSYETTPMARSTGPAGDSEIPAGRFQHRASGKQYTITRDGTVRIRGGGQPATQRFDYRIGSGAAGYSYIIARDGFLFQAPITWYRHAQRWDAAPGYQDDPIMAWDRPIEPSCLMCHASQVVPVFGTQNRYIDPPFRQNGVACERCHGPGSDHAAGHGKMIVPSRLDAERRDDVCRQCHLLSESRIPRAGHVFSEYRAGLRLGDYVAYIVRDEPGSEPALRATSHLEKMNASRCKIASGDKLWCGTCHDVHTVPADPVAWYRTKCEGCHTAETCGRRRGNNCIACHMPKAKAVDAGHGVFTDHSIPRRPRATAPSLPTSWRLKPFGPADAGDRELGLAYLEAYSRTRDERQKAEALRLLRQRP
jgi:hypothetical protein